MSRHIALISLTIFALQGCATLSESECDNADWHLIGLEDGSKGREISYISNHRKACAEYDVKPNLELYQLGHAEGAVLFCTPRKAFHLGSNGRSHNDICPVDLRDAFIEAYDDGRLVYSARQDLREAGDRRIAAQQELAAISESLATLEANLVSGGGTAEQRQAWLNEVKLLQLDQGQLELEIHDLEHEEAELQREYEYLSSQFDY